jgi:hypothetical protein
VSVECITARVYGDMSEHNCYIYEDNELINVLTVRVYYHRTRVTARVVARSELEAKAWRVFEKKLSEDLSRVMPKPSEDRVVNNILKEFFEGLVTA